MMIVQSPRKKGQKTPQQSPDRPERPERQDRAGNPKRTRPPTVPFFAPKNLAPSSAIPSSSPAFATPAHPLRPFNPPVPAKAAILPIILPPATLRPLAFRTFTKKHSLTLTSSALQELATFIGRHCGSGWREEGLAEKVLEEVARSWKNRNGGVIVDGSSSELKDILKALEGNMSGGKIITGPRGLSRQNSLLLEPTQDSDHAKTRLGLRPTATLTRDDSQASFGMSALTTADEHDDDDDALADARRWLKVIHAFDQPRFTYNVAKKHFERETSKPSLLPPASHKTDAFRNRFNVIHQRLLRNESFQTSAVAGARAASSRRTAPSATAMQSHKITPIANLLGRHGSSHMLLGMLVVLPTGSLAISDLTGTITLDLSQAVAIPEDSSWFTPGMIVLIDGVYEEEEEHAGKGLSGSSGVGGVIGGRFQGFFVGQPPCEKRRATLGVSGPDGNGADHTIGGGFGWIDFLGVGSERAVGSRMRKLEHRLLRQPIAVADADRGQLQQLGGRGRVVILGELNLDQPRSLQALKKILGLYASGDPEGATPMAFVITGNFTAHAVMARGGSGGSIEYKEYFDALASALAEYPTLLTTATFVFVPGDNDGWVSAFSGGAAVPLPRKPVPDLFTSRIRRVFAAANAEAGLSGAGAGAGAEGGGGGGKKGGEAIWTSNPSRLSLFGPSHELVLFRDDISARLRRASVRLKGKAGSSASGRESGGDDVAMSGAIPPADDENTMDLDDDGDEDSHKQSKSPAAGSDPDAVPYDVLAARKLVKTLLDQGYLAPFRQATRPVHWDYTSALYLYPLPTAVVLVDTTAPPFCVTYEGCHVMNPGSVLVAGRKGAARWIEYEVGKVGKVRDCTF
ncbi:DNA polymerase alpha/epsilon subunit B-domain-containing protein [Bombardia bombarda]|uniref:DNA polymerase epsilon subunit B n=1 Tax=Bombardia bombarda TaxID=252184 RepID=A0AA40BW32_9PEZI|nr:DNA polymerase alpha/epsilon subunit B-domain-containing protein [Bombardia bombarda]